MLPALLLALVSSAQPTDQEPLPAFALSAGTGLRYGMLGIRAEHALDDAFSIGLGIGLPPQVYQGAVDATGVAPALEYAQTGWPAIAASVSFLHPIGGGHLFQMSLDVMFMNSHTTSEREELEPYATNRSLALGLLFGARFAIVGPLFVDVALGPSLTVRALMFEESEFDKTRELFGLDWAAALGFVFF